MILFVTAKKTIYTIKNKKQKKTRVANILNAHNLNLKSKYYSLQKNKKKKYNINIKL